MSQPSPTRPAPAPVGRSTRSIAHFATPRPDTHGSMAARTAAMGAARAAAASAVIGPGEAPASSHRDSIRDWGVFASTTEALTVTILTELVCGTRKHPEVPSWSHSSSTACAPPSGTIGDFPQALASEHDAAGFQMASWRRRRCARPDGRRQVGRRRRASVRQHVPDRGHDLRLRRAPAGRNHSLDVTGTYIATAPPPRNSART